MASEAQILANRIELRYAQYERRATSDERRINAKQSQFAGHSNERKLLFQQSIMKMNGFADAVKNKPKQTQFPIATKRTQPSY
jgi:hypothetical protein